MLPICFAPYFKNIDGLRIYHTIKPSFKNNNSFTIQTSIPTIHPCFCQFVFFVLI